MRNLLRAAGFSALILFQSAVTYADQEQMSADNQQKLKEVLAMAKASQSSSELLAKFKPQLDDSQYQFLAKKLAGDTGKLPAVKMTGADGFSIEDHGNKILVHFVSVPEGLLSVNGHELDLGKNLSADEQWRRVMAAIPLKGRTHALWTFFIPEAQAQWQWEVASTLGGLVLGAFWLVTGDPCNDLKSPLKDCKDAVRDFKDLHKDHLDWPWKGDDAERLSMLKVDGIGISGRGKPLKKSPCDETDSDCKTRWRDIQNGNCKPPWASEEITSGKTAFGEAIPAITGPGMTVRKYIDPPLMKCTANPELKACLKDLAKYLHGVCFHPEKDQDYYKALGIPNLELPSGAEASH